MTAPGQLVGALPPGTELHEYRIERVLGHGGFGITYLAHDRHLDKPVAIKEYLPADLAVRVNGTDVTVRAPETEEAFAWGRHHFLKEARVLARFQHPNLIQVHRFFELNNTAYFVMEYARGTTLAQLLKGGGTLNEMRLRDLLLPVCDGLEAVHREGILHRDIKPDNIILRPDGVPVLIDFGAARQHLNQMTRSILSVLTAGYAPLEQYASEGNQGPWTDVYALGAVAYRAITGAKPADAVNRVRTDPLVPAARAAAGRYAPHFLAAVDWALRVDAADRPQSVAEWRRGLDGMVVPPPAHAPAPGVAETVDPTVILRPAGAPAPQAPRSRPAVPAPPRALGLGALALLVALLASGAWWWSRRAPQAVPPPDPAAGVGAETAAATAPPQDAAVPAPAAVEEAPARQRQPTARPAPKPAPVQQRSATAQPRAVAAMPPGHTFQDCQRCPRMVVVPAGTFRMGATPGPGVPAWEGPVRAVRIPRPLAFGRDEVTVAQWDACVAAKACPAAAPTHGSAAAAPVVNVSWDAAAKYTQWLSRATGRPYRLPSEAEWEYAARGGTTTARWWGETRKDQCQHANGADRSALLVDGGLQAIDCDDGFAGLAPAGALRANGFGLHHVAGNAWEWVQDCWRDSHAGAPADGAAVSVAGCRQRVIRGGSWRVRPESLRSSARGRSAPEHRGEDLGFRVVAE